VLRRLEAIAYGMHTGGNRVTPAAEISWVETERLLAAFAALNPALEKGQVDSALRREELLTRSGLLLPRPNERAAFYHLSFQEFLAAQRIARVGDDLEAVFHARGPVAEWRPTLLFLFAAQIFNKDAEWGLGLLDRLIAGLNRQMVKAAPGLAVFIAEALELCLSKNYRVPENLAEAFCRLAREAIEDEVELRARQAIGLCLGHLGDPRIPPLRDPSAYGVVKAGTYLDVEIRAPFRLGRYPVTNRQFQDFLEDGGYDKRHFWSDAGWSWLQHGGLKEPAFWRDRRWNGPNQPVVGISFWEAEACSGWAGGGGCRRQTKGGSPSDAVLYIPGAMTGWTESAIRGRPGWTSPHRSDYSLSRGSLSAISRIWRATFGNGVAICTIELTQTGPVCYAVGLGKTPKTAHAQTIALSSTPSLDTTASVFGWCVSSHLWPSACVR
jgi:hypothetical protein